MEEKSLQELFIMRLELEMNLFRDKLFRQEKEDIYRAFYRIEIWEGVYGILLGEAEQLPKEVLYGLLTGKTGILEGFYLEWMVQENRRFEELQEYVHGQIQELFWEYQEDMVEAEGNKAAGEAERKQSPKKI